jgi:hypothetical protein
MFVSGCECSRPTFTLVGIFKLVPRWQKCVHVLGDYVENNDKEATFILATTSYLIIMI